MADREHVSINTFQELTANLRPLPERYRCEAMQDGVYRILGPSGDAVGVLVVYKPEDEHAVVSRIEERS